MFRCLMVPIVWERRDDLMCFFVATERNPDGYHNKNHLNRPRGNGDGGSVSTRVGRGRESDEALARASQIWSPPLFSLRRPEGGTSCQYTAVPLDGTPNNSVY